MAQSIGKNVKELNEKTGGHYTPAQLSEAMAKDEAAGHSYSNNTSTVTRSGGSSGGGSSGGGSSGKTWLETAYGTDVYNAAKTGDTNAVREAVNKRNGGGGGSYTELTKPENFQGSAAGITTYDQWHQDILNQMNQNSSAWWDTDDPAERERLHAANTELSKLLASGDNQGYLSYNEKTGTWSGVPGYNYEEPVFEAPQSQYADMVSSTLQKLTNRPAFSYNPENDMLYQVYANQYANMGEKAMRDVLGQMSARTGGLASSYAGTMAQQEYDNYMTQLAGKIPELYKLAYSMYVDDRDYDMDMLGALSDLEDNEYNRLWKQYTTALDQFNTNRNFNYGVSRDRVADARYEDETAYNRQLDQRDYDLKKEELDYERTVYDKEYKQAMLDELYDRVLNSGYRPTQEDAVKYGLSETELQNLRAQADTFWRSNASRYYGGY